jgi:hypothetical protein
MRHLLFFLALCLVPFNLLSAALPPLYQGMKEIKAIFDDPDLLKYLTSADVIQDISKTEKGYLIKTNKQQLSVKVIYEASNVPGPVKFHLTFEPVKTK